MPIESYLQQPALISRYKSSGWPEIDDSKLFPPGSLMELRAFKLEKLNLFLIIVRLICRS